MENLLVAQPAKKYIAINAICLCIRGHVQTSINCCGKILIISNALSVNKA
jgi:hypothetical protein